MEIFIMTGQPVTCPVCGARARILLEFEIDHLPSQLCKCSNCNYLFIEQEEFKMNIKFSYLYRDAGNYKQHNEVIFTNPNKVPIEVIETIITSKLIDGCWFVAKDWNLPDMHFKEYDYDDEIDHQWHEFQAIEETDQAATTKVPVEEFIEGIR